MTKASLVSEPACFHCQLPIPSGAEWSAEVDGLQRPMCCAGCKAVAEMIVASGNSQFYAYRTEQSPAIGLDELNQLFDYTQLPDAQLRESFVAGDGHLVSFGVIGLRCAACGWLLEKQLLSIPGVARVKVSVSRGEVQVQLTDQAVAISDLITSIHGVGYCVCMPHELDTYQRVHQQSTLKRIGVAGLGTMQVMMVSIGLYAGWLDGMAAHWVDALRWVCALMTTVVVTYVGWPYFYSALTAMRLRRINMDVPIALVLAMAFVASLIGTHLQSEHVYFDSICMFLFFLTIGRYVEADARYKASLARPIKPPGRVLRYAQSASEWVNATELSARDRISVASGYMVPVDAQLLSSNGELDCAVLTGESKPQPVVEGDVVSAGAVVLNQPLDFEVIRPWRESTLGQLDLSLEAGALDKPAAGQLADRVARVFVWVVMSLATLTLAWWLSESVEQAFSYALAVLVVACPCALALAMPTALTAATHGLFKQGLLVVRPHVIEQLVAITDVIFDKTGTLTTGDFSVYECNLFDDELSRETALALAAEVERGVRHPLASAFVRFQAHGYCLTDQTLVPGKGVQGIVDGVVYRLGSVSFVSQWHPDWPHAVEPAELGQQWVYLANQDKVMAAFCVGDHLRGDACDSIVALQAMGVQVHVCSGDPAASPEAWNQRLGITATHTAMTLADKERYVKRLEQDGRVVMTVGDGLNDSGMFGQAAVSVAISTGADLVKGKADAVLRGAQLCVLPETLRIARRCQSIIRQNVTWALAYNVLTVPMAMVGWIPPYVAAIGMTLSSLVVTLNAARAADIGGAEHDGSSVQVSLDKAHV